MNLHDVDQVLMTGSEGESTSMKYAQSYGRAVAVIWCMLDMMEPEDRKYWEDRLRTTAEERKKSAKSLEESTTCQ